jgi:hypothetical protein
MAIAQQEKILFGRRKNQAPGVEAPIPQGVRQETFSKSKLVAAVVTHVRRRSKFAFGISHGKSARRPRHDAEPYEGGCPGGGNFAQPARVDVFFVISGFLITQMIAEQLQAGRFSILSFYERRIRRILPALLAVLFAVYGLGLVYFLPVDMVDLSKSLVAAALSASNVYFWFDADKAAAHCVNADMKRYDR